MPTECMTECLDPITFEEETQNTKQSKDCKYVPEQTYPDMMMM